MSHSRTVIPALLAIALIGFGSNPGISQVQTASGRRLGLTDRNGILVTFVGSIRFPSTKGGFSECSDAKELDGATHLRGAIAPDSVLILKGHWHRSGGKRHLARMSEEARLYLVSERGVRPDNIVIVTDDRQSASCDRALAVTIDVFLQIRGLPPNSDIFVRMGERGPSGLRSETPSRDASN